MIHDLKMDKMLEDIVDIFTNIPEVKYVRLHGLTNRAHRIGELDHLDEDIIFTILQKMKRQNVINWKYVFTCPICKETFFQLEDIPNDQLRICDTCQSFIIPRDNLIIENLSI